MTHEDRLICCQVADIISHPVAIEHCWLVKALPWIKCPRCLRQVVVTLRLPYTTVHSPRRHKNHVCKHHFSVIPIDTMSSVEAQIGSIGRSFRSCSCWVWDWYPLSAGFESNPMWSFTIQGVDNKKVFSLSLLLSRLWLWRVWYAWLSNTPRVVELHWIWVWNEIIKPPIHLVLSCNLWQDILSWTLLTHLPMCSITSRPTTLLHLSTLMSVARVHADPYMADYHRHTIVTWCKIPVANVNFRMYVADNNTTYPQEWYWVRLASKMTIIYWTSMVFEDFVTISLRTSQQELTPYKLLRK